jgi:hypothetical protein
VGGSRRVRRVAIWSNSHGTRVVRGFERIVSCSGVFEVYLLGLKVDQLETLWYGGALRTVEVFI